MKKTLEVLNKLKRDGLIEDYAIGGGIAAFFYTEAFITYDLDSFIVLSGKTDKKIILLSPLFKHLEGKGYNWKGEHLIIEGIPVQFIPVDELEEDAIKHAKKYLYQGIKTKVFSPEYLIAVLLRAGRKKDYEKIQKLLEMKLADMQKLAEILSKYDLNNKFNEFLKK